MEIEKNVKIGNGESLELRGGEEVETAVRANLNSNYEDSEVEESAHPEEYKLRKQNEACHVSETDDRTSAHRVKKSHNE